MTETGERSGSSNKEADKPKKRSRVRGRKREVRDKMGIKQK